MPNSPMLTKSRFHRLSQWLSKKYQAVKEYKISYPAKSLLSSMLFLSLFLLFKKMYDYFPKKSTLHPGNSFIQDTLQKIYFSSKVGRKTLLTLTHFQTIWGAQVHTYNVRAHDKTTTNTTLEVQSNVKLCIIHRVH